MKHPSARQDHLAHLPWLCALAMLVLLLWATPARAADCPPAAGATPANLMSCVTLDGVREHQAALQAIAEAHDGNRAAGTPGFNASVEYVEQRLVDSGYVVSRQPFSISTFYAETPPRLAIVEVDVETPISTTLLALSASGDVSGAVALPSAPRGCRTADFADFPAGSIALIERGLCPFRVKARNAEAAGAIGVVLVNDQPGALSGSLAGGAVPTIPVVGVSRTVGRQLAETSELQLHVTTSTFRGRATTWNLLAESPEGDPNAVVMLGAHLDSVEMGPGLNDNGSGAAALLEAAEQMALISPRNQLRFGFWSAEEGGLIGSSRYVASLDDADLAQIALYLNFDMLASPNFIYFVYAAAAPDAPSAAKGTDRAVDESQIQALFEAFYTGRNLPFQAVSFGAVSDHAPFRAAGVPVGGLYTGSSEIKSADEAALWGGQAGRPLDPCYHRACDALDNVSLDALDVNADAIVFAALHFAHRDNLAND